MAKNQTQRGLGRGLSALLADSETVDVSFSNETHGRTSHEVPIEFLEPNPDQPRKQFDPAELDELVESIRSHGLIQPILVRRVGDDRYQIVAGERRWRAAGRASLHNVPVIIREYKDAEVAQIALIENIQRTDLNPLEEALAYQELMNRFDSTQAEIAKVLGKPRSHIANMVRLLRLEDSVQELVRTGKLSLGHAKLIVSSNTQKEDAVYAIENSLTVRQLERYLDAKNSSDHISDKKRRVSPTKDADTRQLEQELSANLGFKVAVENQSDGSGKIVVNYRNLDDLDRICQLLSQ